MRDFICIHKNNHVMMSYIQIDNLNHQFQKFNLQYKESHSSHNGYVQVLILITKFTSKLGVQG